MSLLSLATRLDAGCTTARTNTRFLPRHVRIARLGAFCRGPLSAYCFRGVAPLLSLVLAPSCGSEQLFARWEAEDEPAQGVVMAARRAGSTAPARSSHGGAGRFLDRRKPGLNSLDW